MTYVCLGLSALGAACGDDVEVLDASLAEAPGQPGSADSPDAGGGGCEFGGEGECDLVTGCGCPSGETCRIDLGQSGTGSCGPLSSAPLPAYSVCTSGSDCPALHSCVGSVCKKQCAVAEDCGWEGARCIAVTSGATQLIGGYCTRECDVAAPEAPDPGFQPCAEGVRCGVTGDGTDCVGALGSAAAGEACTSEGDCASGLYCSSGGSCERLCKVGADDCGTASRCLGADPPLSAAEQEIGTCGCRPPPGQVCDMGVGCGCDAGTTCSWTGSSSGCRLLLSSAAEQESCTSDLDCPAVHACISGVCQRQCVVAADCGWAGAECVAVTDAAGADIAGFNYCTRACDPISPQEPGEGRQPCPSGTQCFPFDEGALCVASGSSGSGAPCGDIYDCAPGTFCGTGGVCLRWCEAGSDDCGTGSTCRTYSEPFITSAPGLDDLELGHCTCAPADGSACDPRNDCGCEGGGTCDFFGGAAPFACREISATPLAPHALCSNETDCPALHSCIHGMCKRLCVDNEDCTAPGSTCLPVSEDPRASGWNYCSISCDPMSPSAPRAGFEACSEGVQCVAGTLGADCFLGFAMSDVGDACSSPADCAPGLFCGLAGVCQAYCELETSGCGPGLRCEAFDFPLRSAGRDFGRCLCPATGTSECDLATDCGCDPGTTCALTSIAPASSACFSTPPNPVEPYAPCDSEADCPALHSCARGVCARRCATASDCGAASCVPQLDEDSEIIPGFSLCSRNCDPVFPTAPRPGLDACGAGAQCFPAETESLCVRAGSAGAGAACDSFDDCLPGLFCDVSGQCLNWCNVAAEDCDAPQVCTSFSPPLIAGVNEWGVCLP